MTDEIAALRLELHMMQQMLKRHDQELSVLKAAMPKRMTFRQQFPDCDTITALQAQMFENPPRQGRSTRVLKVYLWDTTKPDCDRERWPDGYYRPFVFPLQTPKNFRANRGDTPLEGCAESLRDEADWWLGCVEHKGARKKIKGTLRLLCHAAILAPSRDLILSIRGHEFDLGAGSRATKSESEAAPTWIWYWRNDYLIS